MLKLNVNEEKQLNFEIQIGGVQSDQVSSHLRIEIDDVEYGFPAQVGQESITVDLPALRTITARKLKEGEEVEVKLEIIADGHYLTPWSDTFTLSNPLVVEAKIMDADFKDTPAFKTKLVQTGKTGDQKQGVVVEAKENSDPEPDPIMEAATATDEEMTEKLVNKLAEKLSPMLNKQEVVQEKVVQEETKSEPVEETPKTVSKTDVKNITEEGVYQYMTRAGTKNEKVQKLIYEQAEKAAGSSVPVDVLRQVVKLMKTKK